MSGRPSFVSLFAGCGGSSLGYGWAGYREMLAIDNDDNAVETFKLNFDTPVWNRDICGVKGREILDFCGMEKGELDLLDGSPPCQGYSTSGKRQVNDSRNSLFRENIRLIGETGPRVFVIENVYGLAQGTTKGLFKEYMEEMKALDYRVKCKLMNARHYLTPQSRKRLIWIGVHRSLGGDPAYPIPSEKIITAREAIGHLEDEDFDIPIGKGKKEMEYWRRAKWGGSVGKFLARKKLHPYRPSFTLQKGRPNYHYSRNRPLSVPEYALLQGFPEDFRWTGTYYDRIARIGNSVPPRMMEAIARTIRKGILKGR